jgi:Spy/CpxP family protein refolding chaperone
MKVYMTVGLAIAAVVMAGTALAQGPGGGLGPGPGFGPGFGEHRPPMERAFGPQGDHGRWWNNPKLVERLKLTEAQRKSMDETLLAHREKLVDLRGTLEKAELGLEPLMREDQPNEAAILAGIDKVAQARAELEKANARFLLAIRAKLTPEQWKQLEADRAEHEQRGGWERDRTGRDGQGANRQGPGGQLRRPAPPSEPAAPNAAPGAAPQGQSEDAPGPDGVDVPAPGNAL